MKQIPSPNFTSGREGNKISKIIVHWIVGHLPAADAVFTKPDSTSAHYGIEGIDIHQYVQEEDTAWHAGKWEVNTQSIGIEHAGGPDIPISEETYKTSAKLIREICGRYNIPVDTDHILPHSSIVATQCPGTLDIPKLIDLALQDEVDWEALAIRYKSERDAKDTKLEDCRDGRADDKAIYTEHLEQIQKTLSEVNQINTSLMRDKGTWLEDKKLLEARILALEASVHELSEECNELSGEIIDLVESKRELEAKLTTLRAKKNPADYGWLEFIISKIRSR